MSQTNRSLLEQYQRAVRMRGEYGRCAAQRRGGLRLWQRLRKRIRRRMRNHYVARNGQHLREAA